MTLLEPAPPPPRRRHAILALFCVQSAFIGFSFGTFANVPDVARELFPWLTDKRLAWTLNANNLAQIAFTPLAIWLLRPRPGRTGLRVSLCLAATAQALQSGLWAALSTATAVPVPFGLALILAGAASSGLAGALTQGLVTRLSVTWFPPRSRGFATSLAFAAQFAGFAGSYGVARLIGSAEVLRLQLLAQAAVAVALLLLSAAFFSDGPDQPARRDRAAAYPVGSGLPGAAAPKASTASRLLRTSREFYARFDHRQLSSAVVLGGAVAMVNGLFSAYQSTLPLSYQADPGDLLSLVAGVTYPLGSVLMGAAMDLERCARKLKTLLCASLVGMALVFGVMVAWAPPPPWLLSDAGGDASAAVGGADALRRIPPGALAALVGLAGLAAGATMPPGMELLAELGHPLISEGLSANVTMLVVQIFEMCLTALAFRLSPQAVGVVMLGGAAAALALVGPGVAARYRRSA